MMRLPRFDWVVPSKIEEAAWLLEERGSDARIFAGGTDLLVAAKLGNCRPRVLVSLTKIDGLNGITYREGEGMRIGAMTPLCRIKEDSSVRKHYPALAQAAASVGSPQLRRMGTIGGNLCLNTRCHFYNQSRTWRGHRPVCLKMGGSVCHVVPGGKRCLALFSADTPAALMALNARIRIVSREGERLLSLDDFYSGDGVTPNRLARKEIVTEIQLPPPEEGEKSAYLKYRIRKAIDFPLAGVAVRIVLGGDGLCKKVRVVLNALGPAPLRVNEAEANLAGAALSADRIAEAAEYSIRAAHPVANASSTPSYRRRMAGILTRKALGQLILFA